MAKTVDHCIYVHIALSCLFCFTGREHSSTNIYLFSVPVFTMLSYILGVQLWWTQVDTVVISGHSGHQSLKVVENIRRDTDISDAFIEEGAIPIHHRLFLC